MNITIEHEQEEDGRWLAEVPQCGRAVPEEQSAAWQRPSAEPLQAR